jgi:hypothetical protein
MSPDEPLLDRADEIRYFEKRHRIWYARLRPAEEAAKDRGESDSHSGRYLASWFLPLADLLARRGTFGAAAAAEQIRRDVDDAAEDDEIIAARLEKWRAEKAARDAARVRTSRETRENEERRALRRPDRRWP